MKIAVDVSAMECKIIKITVTSAVDIGIFTSDIIISVLVSAFWYQHSLYKLTTRYLSTKTDKDTVVKLIHVLWHHTAPYIEIIIDSDKPKPLP